METHTFNEGDRVQVVDREQTTDDVKSSLFYNHYRGLYGTVQKAYEATGEVAVTVDEQSLPEPIATRHSDVRLAMKTKWLEGLSEEARSRLSDAEKDFKLRYTILVAPTDLKLFDAASVPKPVSPEPAAIGASAASIDEPAPHRKTAAEIEAEEEEYMRTRKAAE